MMLPWVGSFPSSNFQFLSTPSVLTAILFILLSLVSSNLLIFSKSQITILVFIVHLIFVTIINGLSYHEVPRLLLFIVPLISVIFITRFLSKYDRTSTIINIIYKTSIVLIPLLILN